MEHIIPQHATAGDFGRYTSLCVEPLTVDKVIRTYDFAGVPNIGVPPRPHTVTFENIVASCDGTFPDREGTSQCCNHKRGNGFVYPMFYVAVVAEELSFMEDGRIQANDRAHKAELPKPEGHQEAMASVCWSGRTGVDSLPERQELANQDLNGRAVQESRAV